MSKQRGASRWAQSAAEWVAAGVGLVALLVVTGTLLFEAITQDGLPPTLSVQTGETAQQDDGIFHVPVRLRNAGHSTAAGILVEGQLRDEEGETVEEAQFELEYLPPESSRQGGLYFINNPHDYELTVIPRGYRNP